MAPEDSSPPATDLMRNAETDWLAMGWPLRLAACLFPVQPIARPPLVLALSASAQCRERSTVPEHASSLPEAVDFGRGYQRKLRHTTHHQHLPERVTVIRARHPFEGRSLNVLASAHRKGRLHLVLILPDGSKSLIPADWTDLASSAQPPRALSAPAAAHSARWKTCCTHAPS